MKSVTHDHVPWVGTIGLIGSISLSQAQQILGVLVAAVTFLYVSAKLIAFLIKWKRDGKPPTAE